MLGAHRQLTGYYLRHAKVGAMTATSIVYYWKRVRTPSSKTRPLLQVWEQFPPIISTRVQPRPKGCAHSVDIWQLKSQPRPKGRNLDEKHLRLAPQGARCPSYKIAQHQHQYRCQHETPPNANQGSFYGFHSSPSTEGAE